MTNLDKKLKTGVYRISFDISIDREDKLDIADIAQAVTAGFDETSLLPKISNLDIKPLAKTGFQAGDIVQLTGTLEIIANIKEINGNFFVNVMDTESHDLGSTPVVLKEGAMGYIAKVTEEGAVVHKLNVVPFVALLDPETDELLDYPIRIDAVLLPTSSLEKVEEETDDVE